MKLLRASQSWIVLTIFLLIIGENKWIYYCWMIEERIWILSANLICWRKIVAAMAHGVSWFLDLTHWFLAASWSASFHHDQGHDHISSWPRSWPWPQFECLQHRLSEYSATTAPYCSLPEKDRVPTMAGKYISSRSLRDRMQGMPMTRICLWKYSDIRLQWHWLQWQFAFSDTFGKS